MFFYFVKLGQPKSMQQKTSFFPKLMDVIVVITAEMMHKLFCGILLS